MSYTEKEALEFLVGLGETKILGIGEHQYTTKKVYRVTDPQPASLEVTTLTALIDYIKSDFDPKYGDKGLIHVVSPSNVEFYSELREDKERENYMSVKALLPDNLSFERFMDMESFNVMLQSGFIENNARSMLLKVAGNVKEDAIKQVGDDGVSQSATIKTGVASVNEVVIPNPVILAPFRTFPEIEQVESKFVFRMKSGPSAALFPADAGAWRNTTMQRIKEYLEDQLEDKENIKIIS